MAKLHEILAVEGDLEGTVKKIFDEAQTTFTKRAEHFLEEFKKLTMFDEGRKNEDMEEHKAMVTTVHQKLDYVWGHLSAALDNYAKKEATNQEAKADLEVDGIKILEQVPATLLLGLESRLKNLRGIYETIPTLQPGTEWIVDENRENGVFRSKDQEERMRTEKSMQHKILYDATEKHPAQIEKWSIDKPIGRISVERWSGMLSSAEKSQLLGRIDKLIRGTKKARQRANNTEVKDLEISSAIHNFIHQSK